MSEERFVKLVATALKAGGVNTNGRLEVERAIDVLKELESFTVTTQLLEKTSGGRLLRKLSKSNVAEIATAAKSVITVWKAKVGAEEDALHRANMKKAMTDKTEYGGQSPPISDGLRKAESTELQSTGLGEASSSEKSLGALVRKGSVTSQISSNPKNRAREVARKKIMEHLILEEKNITDVKVDSETAAKEIESAIYKQFGDPAEKSYLSKFRTLNYNLKDTKNGSLRRKILRREIHAAELVNLTSEELANDEKKRENDDIRKNKLRECERGVQQSATTDMFKCGKCKANACTYYQLQTRSADEPMTTYVTCTKCGHRWKC